MSDNEDVKYWSTVVLGAIGREALTPLIEALRTDNKEIRFFAAEALGKIRDPQVIPYLLEALRDKSWPVRKSAADALEEIGEAAIGPLIKALKNENNDIRFWTKRILRNFGDLAIVPLEHYLLEGDDDLKIYAAYALGEIRNERSLTVLMHALNDGNEWVRRYVVSALAEIGNVEAVPAILESMKKESDEMCLLNIKIMRKFGKPAVAEIIRYITPENERISSYLVGMLKTFGPEVTGEIINSADLFIDSKYACEKLAALIESFGDQAAEFINGFAAANPGRQNVISFLSGIARHAPKNPSITPRIQKR